MVLQILVRIYSGLKTPDYINICQCYIFLNDAESAAQILEKLSRGSSDEVLIAYQIAFDLYESATQHFLSRVQECIRGVLPVPKTPHQRNIEDTSEVQKSTDDKMEVEELKGDEGEGEGDEGGGGEGDVESKEEVTENKEEPMDLEPDTKPTDIPSEPIEKELEDVVEPEEEWMRSLRCVASILKGEKTVALHQEFLIRTNHTDLQILRNTKEAGRNSITHNATVISNGIIHYGTTSDIFLRENLEWLKRASNWAKFTATASLGVIHYGHENEALNLMSSYLPKDSTGSFYTEGGGLYALGLIHANHGGNIIEYLSNELRNNQNEIVRHGGCYGLGLAAMGTADNAVYDLLKDNLCQDDAVVGEAAGLAMGLVMIGTRSPTAIHDMIEYAQETQHVKIQRGLALGIAMLFYGQLEEADGAIEQLCQHKDPLLRRAGMFTIAMAYCGTGDNVAIRRLLHVAVSDVDSDVRRAAVTCLGFILFRNPELCPNVVSLLAESFNPHVRCGAAWALGIACAASGNKEALSIIEPMLSDPVAFVQQGALVASALLLIQQNESMNSKVPKIRETYSKIIGDKLEDSVAKFGAILAQGVIDAGGRNVTISLQSRTGHTHMPTIVGLLVFTQFWFWFPLSHFLSLSFTPTSIIGLNQDLQMPKLEMKSNAKPSMFGYFPYLEKEKSKEKEKVATAILSVTGKKLRTKTKKSGTGTEGEAKDKMEEESVDSMEVESAVVPPDAKRPKSSEGLEEPGETQKSDDSERTQSSENKNPPQTDSKDKEKEKKPVPEPSFEMLSNPARVLPSQLKVISLESGSRYQSLKPISSGGILMLKDTQSEKPEELIEPIVVVLPGQDDEEDEPSPPEPFEYTED